ncbi:NAD(P)H-binding domain-containing protein [Sarocladium implicatum]|nr:NAD(P)H-binding domain-containing protein [Sarocladium implicatum]
MKVIVVGATGRCGGQIARLAIADDRFTKVLLVTRSDVAEDIARDPKCEVIKLADFTTWPEDLMTKLHGAEACLWAVGGRVDQLRNDKVYCRKVNVEFTHAAAKAMNAYLAPLLPAGQNFRFAFCSGSYSEWDQSKRLLFLGDSRRIKGEIEKLLCEMDDAEERFESWILRPMGLHDKDTPAVQRKFMRPLGFSIETVEVARVMIKIALDGAPQRIIENDEIIKLAC